MTGRASGWEPSILAMVCRWCTYAGADTAGTNRRSYPANVRLLRVPCTGRVSALQVLRAFELGADGVIVSGCHPGNCHYVQGNLIARRRFAVLRSLLDFVGLDPRRLHFAWVSASESTKWVQLVEEVTAAVREAGPLRAWEDVSDRRAGEGAEHSGGAKCPAGAKRPAQAHRPPFPGTAELAALQADMRQAAASLLRQGAVSLVLGYGHGSLPQRVIPTMVRSEELVHEMIWDERCAGNLAVYLPRLCRDGQKVGVLVKRCDLRAVVGLFQEEQIRRQDVVVIGIPCGGVRDGAGVVAKCSTCSGEVPDMCDIAVGGARERSLSHETQDRQEAQNPRDAAGLSDAQDPRDGEIAFLEALPPEARWTYWQAQFARCIRCYACRAVCPLCYCDACIVDRHRPPWVSRTIDRRGNTTWNLVRALHLAGRCVGCDACAGACPAGIRLDLLNRQLANEVERRFGYVSGVDAAATPPLASFHREDGEEFIR